MRIEDIQEHLDKYNDYDIRQNKNCRFVDQKCTPDVVCFIADCILSTDCATKAFTVSDLWKTQFFIENTRIVFHKPYVLKTEDIHPPKTGISVHFSGSLV